MMTSNGELSLTAARAGLADLYAAGLSALCLLHCLALPLLASLLPFTVQLADNAFVHQSLVLLAAPATLWVGWQALSTASGRPFLLAAGSGLALLLTAAFVDAVAAYEQPMTTAGALLLAWAHLRRWLRYRRASRQRLEASDADTTSDMQRKTRR